MEKEFRVHGHKMTVYKVFDPLEENSFGVCFKLEISDLETSANMFFPKEETQTEVFENADQELAESMYQEIVSGLNFVNQGTDHILQVPKNSES